LEEALTVDALSCGRLELGVGRGGVPFQFVGYGIPKDEIDDRYEESLSIIEHGWKNGFVQANGKHFKIPKVDIYPRPQQKSPPISVVVRSEPGIREAASQGWPAIISLMIHRMNGNLAEMADAYYKSFREVDKRKPHLSVVVPVFVGESSKGVRATIERSVYDIYRRNFGGIVNYAILEQTAAAWGNADTVLSNLKAVKDLTKAEEIVGWFNLGGLVGHRETLQSMQLFAHSVMGRLND
jgi:alkanesulfonate monooxygenase SsuD/methylene tetrahydromethanopterin reductase-like flavin-dependent oxidoreductase (luciferase family)